MFDGSGLHDGHYPDPNSDTHFISWHSAQEYVISHPLPLNHDGSALVYILNSGPNPATSRGDYPEVAGSQVTAGSARVSGVPLAVHGLNAKLEWDGQPVHCARVTFTDADGRELAHGYTGADGRVVCDSAPLPATRAERTQRLAALARGYTATYAGGGSIDPEVGWQPSSGQGAIDTVDAASVELTAAEIAELPDGYMAAGLRTLPAGTLKLLISKLGRDELIAAAGSRLRDSGILLDEEGRLSTAANMAEVEHNAPYLLAGLAPERLAEILDSLDDTTTAALEETFVKIKEDVVLEQGRRDAEKARAKARADLIAADLDDRTVVARTPSWKVKAYQWVKSVEWGGVMYVVDTFRPGFEFADISTSDTDYYKPYDGNHFEQCLRDAGESRRITFIRDPRSGWYVRSSDLEMV